MYGSFYTIGGQINLDAKFVNVDSGKVLKAASVHGAYPDRIFDLQEDLAKKLTGAINGTVNEKQTENMNEYISSTADYAGVPALHPGSGGAPQVQPAGLPEGAGPV